MPCDQQTTPERTKQPFQFGLRRLLVVTLLVSLSIGLAVQFTLLNVLAFLLLTAVVLGVAMSRRKRTLLDGEGPAECIRQRHAEYERQGGWACPFINMAFCLSIALSSAFSAIWYDGLHDDIGEFAGVFQFVTAWLIGCLMLCVALTCLTVTLIKFSKLRMAQRILGVLPIALFALVCGAAYFRIPPFHR